MWFSCGYLLGLKIIFIQWAHGLIGDIFISGSWSKPHLNVKAISSQSPSGHTLETTLKSYKLSSISRAAWQVKYPCWPDWQSIPSEPFPQAKIAQHSFSAQHTLLCPSSLIHSKYFLVTLPHHHLKITTLRMLPEIIIFNTLLHYLMGWQGKLY